jgi:RNA-directed DNA polymerase
MKRQTPFDQLCELETLMPAWKQVRANKGAAGIDLVTIAEFERDLVGNLRSLAERLREGRYYPMPVRTVEMKKRGGGTRTLGILTVEDRILQRAVLDLTEPLWEPAFLDCSFGFRPGRNVEMAVKRVLDFRAAGDAVLVDADIRDCFGSIRHDLLMQFVSARIRDKRMLTLIRMWVDSGQALGADDAADLTLLDRLTGYASESVEGVITNLLDRRSEGLYAGYSGYAGYGAGYGQYAALPDAENREAAAEAESRARGEARKEVLKRIGENAVVLGLTYFGRTRRLLSPATIAVAGAAALIGAAYPAASRAVRQRLGTEPSTAGGVGTVQGGALSPLLCNIYLHEFDLEMARAGLRLVRYADDFVICCRTEAEAQRAMELAARKLGELRLQMHPDKTRITRFDQGFEFLGYRFDQFTVNAAPIPPETSVAAALVARTTETVAPAVAKLKQGVTRQARKGAEHFSSLARRLQKGGKS